jgi:hypothetical protein
VAGYPEPELNAADNTATVKLMPAVVPPTGGGNTGGTPPGVFKPPAINGIARVGGVLHVSAPTWTATPTRVTHQWQLCSASGYRAIAGATHLTLRILAAYRGKTVRLVATALIGGQTIHSYTHKTAIRP